MMMNPPAKAGDMGSIPGLGRFHMPWSNQACAPQRQKSPQRDALALHLKSSPHSLQLERSLLKAMKASAAKNK